MKETIPKYTPGLREAVRKSENDELKIFQKEWEEHLLDEDKLIENGSKNKKWWWKK
ncbi:30084_t:CDS:1 [Racocetra persica]|uniref:30084_t:CDS:1 n=1 Tax=Racocetra persica TaxID=160502 RepID=A0ACA9RTT4_9GLOM|nr:30084_t:CDS:1 [Racocetra persica]